jgi:hypothetical protein
MPAKNPRLTITMRPGLHALLRRLSELTGQSQSALIFELLDGAEPVLTRVIRLLEASNDAKAQLHGRLAGQMASAQKRIEHQLAITLDDLGEEDVPWLLEDAEAVHHRSAGAPGAAVGKLVAARRRARRSGNEGTQPPSSNRGVRSLTKQKKVNTRRAEK